MSIARSSRCFQRALVIAVSTFVLAAVPAAAEDAPRNTKPFTRYKVLLGQIVNGTLPFDVPFIIWGEVDRTMTDDIEHAEVTLLSAEFKSLDSCSSIAEKDYRLLAKAKVAKWTDTDFTDRGEAVPTDPVVRERHQFEMLIRPLEPRRLYCFRFQVSPGKQISTSQQRTLIAAILPAYQAFLRNLGLFKELGASEVEDLRQSLSRAMLAAVPLRGVTARRNSVFDPEANPADVAPRFTLAMADVITHHQRAVEKLESLQAFKPKSRNEEDLEGFLWWARAPALRTRLQGAAAGSPLAAVNDVALLGDEDIKRVMIGLPRGGPDEIVSDLWQVDRSIPASGEFEADDPCPAVEPLATRCARIDTLARLLSAAATALHGGPPPPPPASRKTPLMTTAELAGAIESSAGDLRDRKVNLLEVQHAINQRHSAMVRHIADLETLVPTSFDSVVTTDGDLATRRRWYMSADTGLAVGVSINEVLPYAGTNLYFRPVNTEAPPGKFLTRFSALVGFTWTDNILKEGERASLYGTSVSLVLGAGLRLTEILKVSGGVLMFKGVDPNPTIQDTRLEVSPFVSISGDFDVAKLLGGLFGNDANEPNTIGAGSKPE